MCLPYLGHRLKIMWVNSGPFSKLSFQGSSQLKREFQKLSPETIARFVKPFVMRRKKDEVLQELPDLIETTYHNELDESQKTIYLAQLKQIQDRVRSSSEEELNRSKVEILSGLMRLRQICDTPALFMEDYQEIVGNWRAFEIFWVKSRMANTGF